MKRARAVMGQKNEAAVAAAAVTKKNRKGAKQAAEVLGSPRGGAEATVAAEQWRAQRRRRTKQNCGQEKEEGREKSRLRAAAHSEGR